MHNRLIVALADALTPQLLPKYQVDIEKRVYIATATEVRTKAKLSFPRRRESTLGECPNRHGYGHIIVGLNSLLLSRPNVTVQRPLQLEAEGALRV